ncbi:Mur ligase family protein [Demequina capsici]|uniref:tetrahydrofolate synthase n=1 Tax=Demequina capsici TaxID=3075620 RepID=A0AA96FAZ6_9MICO|nr:MULTISPECIES: Mur ligase family protein [unclassified Demequina]WNM23471.1 Mur ligase family protein [Demequina sp. OYTSA14]WNM26348.1 Mur ligase family protein [Demequina sp. PMTSA13]
MTTAGFPQISLAEAEREIDSHIFARHPEADHEAKLLRVSEALGMLGDPQRSLRIVHVTGTNGKTSTSRMIESLLRASGQRTGLYTSPHLTTLRERIQIDGRPLPQEDLIRLWQRVAPAIHAVDAASLQRGGPRMSFFEVLTVLGFTAYADAAVDVAVIEVGIGGRRDATNVGDGRIAVLTPMALDHDGYFTGGLPGVASEKSGIIKPGATVVSALQRDEAAEIITAAAADRGASIFWEGAHMSIEARRVAPGGQIVTLRTAAATYEDVLVPLHGDFQAQNALTALAAVEVALGDGVPRSLDPEVVARGFAAATSPGRLEVIAADPIVIGDAAHNPHGIEALARSLHEAFGLTKVVGVVAVLGDKDYVGILEGLAPILDHAVVTRTESHRALPVDVLVEHARRAMGEERVSAAPDVATALAEARALAAAHGENAGVLVAGSITLVGQARRELAAQAMAPVTEATLSTAQRRHSDEAADGGASEPQPA